MYTKHDVANAPTGTIRFEGTGVEVVTYQIGGSEHLSLIVNINGICAYRATLEDAFRPQVVPNPFPPTRAIEDTFVVRKLKD